MPDQNTIAIAAIAAAVGYVVLSRVPWRALLGRAPTPEPSQDCAAKFEGCLDAIKLMRELGLPDLAEMIASEALPRLVPAAEPDKPRRPPQEPEE